MVAALTGYFTGGPFLSLIAPRIPVLFTFDPTTTLPYEVVKWPQGEGVSTPQCAIGFGIRADAISS